MLEPAIKYKEQLEAIQYNIWFNKKYMYWNSSVYYEPIKIDENTWDRHQFVSTHNGEVIGYIAYSIARSDNSVYSVSVLNFSDNKIVFGRDLMKALHDIFEVYHFRKISFHVIVGNPIERSYDRMIKKFNGRIVGVMAQEVKLLDGKYYDKKLYEILACDYFSSVYYFNRAKKIRSKTISDIDEDTIGPKMITHDYQNRNRQFMQSLLNQQDEGYQNTGRQPQSLLDQIANKKIMFDTEVYYDI